ncbi:hypothetical protein BMS3Bbin15_01043 [archaeon BMS3Bbin15]|nr:hypothetical protein BMS3Bbin15_01043 [archaeon BMS3Bbin15]
MNDYICNIESINKEIVEEVRKKMLGSKLTVQVSDIFKILGDSTRVKILYALFQEELCVCEISALLCMSQSAVSHQLRILRSSNLVKFRREGKAVYYSLADEHIIKLIEMGVEHAKE